MNYNTKYNTIRFLSILCVLTVFTFGLMAQKSAKKNDVQPNIVLTVTDESGKILPEVQIVVGEGEKYLRTDKNGVVTFNATAKDMLKIVLTGYAELTIPADAVMGENTVRLQKQKLFASNDDIVALPYINLKKRNITGSSMVLKNTELDRYAGTDFRNNLTGLAAGLEVREINGSTGVSVIENYNSEKIDVLLRGRSPMYIIDGTPTDMTEMPLDPSEVESITVIRDVVAKAMYGPTGADGILYVKTKRGQANERVINANFEKGVSFVDRMPTWTNGADYAQLNNLARFNSGLPTLYTDDAIAKYAANDGYDMYYPSNNFRELMFKKTKDYNRANVSTSGGNEGIRYFSYLGFSNEGDLFKIGSPADYSRIISRSNLDIKINDYLKVKFGIYGAVSIRRAPNYGGGTEFSTFNDAFNDANTIAPVAFPIYANNDAELEKPWYAVTTNYQYNPIGGLVGKGFYNETGRSGATNIAFDYDMSHLVKGLSSETYIGFNLYNLVRKGKAENYTAYTVKPSLTLAGTDTIILTKVRDAVDQADLSKLTDYYFQRFAVSQSFKHEANIGKANLQNTLSYFVSRVTRDGYEDSQRSQNFVWSGILNYDDKYSIQAVANYAGTYSFAKENRYQFFPSIGASWVISEEDFMKGVESVNYLKIRAETGILGYDNFQAPFYFRDNYSTNTSGQAFGPYSTNTWFGTTTENSVNRTSPSRIGNPNLSWEKRKEVNVGIDALLISSKLYMEVNYYNNLREGIISQITSVIPDVVGISSTLPRYNYNNIRYYGVETTLRYTDKVGDFRYSIGGNAAFQKTRYEKIDEPNYRNAYQSRLGQPIDGYWGLNYIGRFESDAETQLIPQLFDDELHTDDLKYKDMNGDGVVDDNDKTMIGNTSPRLVYAVNIDLKYKSFEFSIVGTGRAFYHIPLTNNYFWNGWGDNNYSSFVRNNIGGAYPRLTYNKVNNNFIGSNFWLARGDHFKIQNIELAYNLPEKLTKLVSIRNAKIFVSGSNLLTLSKITDVDPESINSGVTVYPLFTNITGGIKLTF